MALKKRICLISLFIIFACALLSLAVFSACKIPGNPGDNPNNDDHEHHFSDEWTYDYRGHWHLYDCGHPLDSDFEIQPHNFENYVCTVCGYHYVTRGLEYKVSEDGKTCALKGIGEATDEVIVVPDSASRNATVTSVDPSAFKDNTHIKGIILPDTVTSVSVNAFSGCTSLEFFQGGENLEVISASAFSGCTSLKDVKLSKKLDRIIYSAFERCTALEKIDLPDSLRIFGYGVFDGCSSLKEITVPEVTGIDNYTFRNCSSLESVTLPSTLQVIRDSAFEGCTALKDINIPSNVGTLGKKTFKDCSLITSIEIPLKVTAIPDEAFKNCSALETVTINGKITEYGESIFSGCSSLKSMTLPFTSKTEADATTVFGYLFGKEEYEGGKAAMQWYSSAAYNYETYYVPSSLETVTITGGKILYGAFSGCADIKTINLPEGITAFDGYVFQGCSSLTDFEIPSTVKTLGASAFSGCSSLTEVTIPQSVTRIENGVFSNCTSLISVTIPKNTATFRVNAFKNCTIDSVIYEGSIADWCNISFQADSNPLYNKLFIGGSEVTELVIPESVEKILMNTFMNFKGLKSVTLHDNLSEIGYYSFTGSGITQIEIPDSVTTINQYAFKDCVSLESVKLPENLTAIETAVFCGCTSLTEITLPDSVATIGASSFAYTGLTHITLPANISDISKYAFTGSGIAFNTYEGGLYLGSADNDYCALIDLEDTALTTLTVHADTEIICYSVLSGCGNLESLTVPFIGRDASADTAGRITLFGWIFGDKEYEGGKKITQNYAKTSSTESYIPASLNSVTVTGGKVLYGAFSNCDMIENIVLPDGITEIGERAFYECKGLKELNIPDGVTQIGDSALYNCSAIKKLTIPDSAASFGIATNLPALEEITAPASVFGLYVSVMMKKAEITSGTSLADEAFKNRKNLQTVILADSITTIGTKAFLNCTALTELTMPSKLWKIGESAFESCTNLTTLTFPEQNNLQGIGDRAFYNCSALEEFVIPTKVQDIGSYAFYGCDSLNYTEHDNALYLGKADAKYAYYYLAKAKDKYITSCTIPSNTAFIQDEAFKGCVYLTELTIPDSMKVIGTDAFSGCKITKVSMPAMAIDSVPKTYEDLTISSGKISALAYQNYSLKKLTIGTGVTEIGRRAFHNCTTLETATFLNPVGWRCYNDADAAPGTGIQAGLYSGDSKENALKLKNINSRADQIWRYEP